MTDNAAPGARDVMLATVAGCTITFLSFGFSAAFGVFLGPVTEATGWGREVFGLSVAIQLLFWGVTQPLAGIVADRRGPVAVLFFGAIMAALGYLIRGIAADPTIFVLSGVVVGIGTGAASFPVVIVALGKVVAPERRSFILGLGTASASVGMFVSAPLSIAMIDAFGWQPAAMLIALSFLAILPALPLIARVGAPTAKGDNAGMLGRAVRMAFQDRSYILLFVGFYVCGFHVAFIQTHLPAYITDLGLAAAVGGASLALIGLFNIAGSFLSGWSGQRYSKKSALAGIYLTRAAVIAIFLLIPVSPLSVYVFSAAMGLLWLSTIPLTTGLVAQTQGLRYLSTLVGLVFFSHQLGSFTGAWLGGRLYDINGDYTLMWWAAVALGVAAAVIHWPIRESPGPLARANA